MGRGRSAGGAVRAGRSPWRAQPSRPRPPLAGTSKSMWSRWARGSARSAAMIAAHDRGAEVVVLEKAPRLGGLSRLRRRRGLRSQRPADERDRYRRLATRPAAPTSPFLVAGYAEPALQPTAARQHARHRVPGERRPALRWTAVEGLPDYYYPDAPGSNAGGRYLSVKLFDGAQLGAWQTKTYPITPHVPPGALHKEMYAWGGLANVTQWDFELLGQRMANDLRSFGPGMMGWFVKAAMVDRGIPAHVETPVRALVTDDGARGRRARRAGRPRLLVRARARRGPRRSAATTATRAGAPVRGDARVALRLPALPARRSPGDGRRDRRRVASVPPTNLAMFFGYHIPGEEHDGVPLWRSSWECGCPHAIWVNRAGRSASATSRSTRTTSRALRAWDGQTQSMPNLPPFLIFDHNYRERYPLGSFMPGPADARGAGAAGRHAARAGGEARDRRRRASRRTLARFNASAAKRRGSRLRQGLAAWSVRLAGDPSYPNPNVGPVDKPPFYGVRLVAGVGVGINSHGLAHRHRRAGAARARAGRSPASTPSGTPRRCSISAAATRAAPRTCARSPGAGVAGRHAARG